MPGKKRKSQSQPVISKFFKRISQSSDDGNQVKRQKKVAVIQILDDDVIDRKIDVTITSSSSRVPVIEEVKLEVEVDENMISRKSVNENSMKKLARFSFGEMKRESSTNFQKESPNISKESPNIPKESPGLPKETLISVDGDMEDSLETRKSVNEPKSLILRESSPSKDPLALIKTNDARSKKSVNRTKVVYTPLEQQVLEVRKSSHGALLMVECGYKYRFFGQDAEIAAKELNICCYQNHNFMSASIPVHRLDVHLTRLIEKGYKVGVVKQVETAALKAASDNKNAPFARKLTNIYTKATYIDREGKDINQQYSDGHYIFCIGQTKCRTNIPTYSIVAVNPTTSDVVYDQYIMTLSDVVVALETILTYLKPCEFVLSRDQMNDRVEKVISSYIRNNIEQCLVERVEQNTLIRLMKQDFRDVADGMALISCFSLLDTYLRQFKLDGIVKSVSNFRKFRMPKQGMVLDGITLRNLEVFQNNTDGGVRGSLFRLLDHTCTPFGRRLLKRWISNPLVTIEAINHRLDAVSQLSTNWELDIVKHIRKGLAGCSDLENGLTLIVLKKATPAKFIRILDELEKLRTLFLTYVEESSRIFSTSPLLPRVYREVAELLSDNLEEFLGKLNREKAKVNDKENVFNVSKDLFPDVFKVKQDIRIIEEKLEEYRTSRLPKILRKLSVEYKCVSGLEYLVEVKNTELKSVSADWIKISATKQFTRFRPPQVDQLFKELCRTREFLSSVANSAWLDFLEQFVSTGDLCKKAVEKVAIFDCLMSLAIVAKQPGYCRPCYDKDFKGIEIQDGIHPVIEDLLPPEGQYVANDTRLNQEQKVLLISGPNMGGKSSYIKQVAINCLLGQLGSYVAASSAKLCVLDGIYTRMGASDNIARGMSTFMVELEEASRILRQATTNSLVILDELGRGTSTFDGMAIASATLKYFIEDAGSFTLFVSHYPILKDFDLHPTCSNYHMGFIANNNIQHSEEISDKKTSEKASNVVFLYKLTQGIASKSYGLNVARLAGIGENILDKAKQKADEMEKSVEMLRLFRTVLGLSESGKVRKNLENINLDMI